jgi:hypothetical protein
MLYVQKEKKKKRVDNIDADNSIYIVTKVQIISYDNIIQVFLWSSLWISVLFWAYSQSCYYLSK